MDCVVHLVFVARLHNLKSADDIAGAKEAECV